MIAALGGVGAYTGSLVGALVNSGLTEEEAHYYQDGLRRGGVFVAVSTDQAGNESAMEILQQCGAIRVGNHSQRPEQEDWQPRKFESNTKFGRRLH